MKKQKKERIISVVGIALVLIGGTYTILDQPIIKYADEKDLPDQHIKISVDTNVSFDNAYYIPYGNCSSCFKNKIEVIPNKDKTYALYGENAEDAAKFMEDIGFTNIYIVRSYENE